MKLLDFLFPPKCLLCGRLLEDGEADLCDPCLAEAPVLTGTKAKLPFLKGWTAVWFYEGDVRRSLLRYKFHGNRGYARCYGQLLAEKVLDAFPEGFDCLTWAPISRRRRLKRGFDQSKLLAQELGTALGIPPIRLLKKIRHNKPQSGISGQAHRRANVLGVYRVTEDVTGLRILLIDDIITTGATVGECARMLLTAGAKEVYCAAVACARHDTKTK